LVWDGVSVKAEPTQLVGLPNAGKLLVDRAVVRSSARTVLLGVGDLFAALLARGGHSSVRMTR
jgi:hypothetical protein